jgi:ribosomal protein S25
MAEVDQVTGLPLSVVEQDKKAEKYAQANEKKAKADQLRADLESEAGKSVLSCIEEQFLNRVNKLISEDPECVAYKKIIVSMGVTLQLGEKAVKDLMTLLIKK